MTPIFFAPLVELHPTKAKSVAIASIAPPRLNRLILHIIHDPPAAVDGIRPQFTRLLSPSGRLALSFLFLASYPTSTTAAATAPAPTGTIDGKRPRLNSRHR